MKRYLITHLKYLRCGRHWAAPRNEALFWEQLGYLVVDSTALSGPKTPRA